MNDQLDDRLAALADEGVTRLSYFHCDHFEPWRWGRGLDGLCAENADAVERFLEALEPLPYARRLTLFMKSPIRATMAGRHRLRTLEGDEIGFEPVRKSRRVHLTRALRAIAASEHELQIHIHHERFTRNEHYSTSPDRPQNEPFRAFLGERSTPAMDSARLRYYLELTLRLFRKTGVDPLDRWFFVHGMWSLNGSDRDFCCVDDEIALLHALGCRGDFTFPAPREHCNPAKPAPYLFTPVTAPKGYDLAEAEPVPATGGAANGRFFIWSTEVSARLCSLDTVSRSFAGLAEDPARWAANLLARAPVLGDAAYIKTHAHSMMFEYFDGPEPVYPHTHPAVRALFDGLMEAAARRGIAFDPITAGEAYDRFVAPC